MEIDFSKKRRRKKKHQQTIQAVTAHSPDAGEQNEGGSGGPSDEPRTPEAHKTPTGPTDNGVGEGVQRKDPASPSDELYSYAFLLKRLQDTLRVDQPTHPSLRSDKQRSNVPPPKLVRVGGRRVGICNFGTICAAIHRPPEHAQSFLLSELATTGSLDAAAESLTLLAALQTKQAEQLIKKYVQEYVLCGQCRALETTMVRGKGRAEILRCSCCNAERLLPPIKTGFIAVRRGERRANRIG